MSLEHPTAPHMTEDAPRALFITPVLASRGVSGGLITTLARLDVLSQRYNVTIVCIEASKAVVAEHKSRWPNSEVLVAGEVRPRSALTWLRSLLGGHPLSVWRNMPPEFLALAPTLDDAVFDMTYVDHWLMWPLASRVQSKGRVIVLLHNAEHLIFARASATYSSFLSRTALKIESRRAAKYLAIIGREADELHFVSEADEHEVLKLEGVTAITRVFRPWVPDVRGDFGTFGVNVLFVGTMSWLPNLEGVAWYIRAVAPRLPSGFMTHIVGGGTDIAKLPKRENIKVHGWVEDLDFIYKSACVFVAPVLSGSGIKMKILNALTRGIPVVTTSLGVEGFPVEWGEAIAVADTPEGFAEAICSIAQSEARWERAAKDATDYVAREFSSSDFLSWAAGNNR